MFQVCNTLKQLEQQVFLLQLYMSKENINIPKYLAFLLKTSSLYPEESVHTISATIINLNRSYV